MKFSRNEIALFVSTLGLTIGGFVLSGSILQNESDVKFQRREAIFYDRLRMNERRIANGFPPLRDEDITDPEFLTQWRDFKQRNKIGE